jgi:hypothetical protein
VTTITYHHPRWTEFAERMQARPTCDGTLTHTRAALNALGADEEESLSWLASLGGFCDCEVMLNVVINRRDS